MPTLVLLLTCLLASARADTPSVLVPSGVQDFSLRQPKVFWHVQANCFPQPDGGPVGGWDRPEELWRIASSGAGATRKLFSENPPRATNICNPYDFHSAILADDAYLYWVEARGLVRLSTDANPGDPVQVLSAQIIGSTDDTNRFVELAQDADAIFAKTFDGTTTRVLRVNKSTLATTTLRTIAGGNVRDLQHDGKYLYWIRGETLERLAFGRIITVATISTGVSGFHAEGFFRSNPLANGTEIVFIARGRQIVRYDNVTGETSAPIYTSANTSARIYELVSTKSSILVGSTGRLFFLEARPIPAPPGSFIFNDQLLFRIGRGGGTADLLYTRAETLPGVSTVDDLATDGTLLYWQDLDRVVRLPTDAEALPVRRLRVTNVEVTQGIQNLSNQVFLVEDRRTFVRVHVRSDDASVVPGVSAQLRGRNASGDLGFLYPVNSVGTKLTVYPAPDRADLNHSYLFELPTSWTRTGLQLTAFLNPNALPLENTYADNTMNVGPFTFRESPRFEPHLVQFRYSLGNTLFSPSFQDDVLQLFSYMRRQYPLASAPGFIQDSGQGLRPSHEIVYDDKLGSRVNQTHSSCLLGYSNDDRSLCASDYAKARLADWRISRGDYYRIYCGMMFDPPDFFPRGSASGLVCTTPTGPDDWGWDTDGSYGDWYGAHEIGHCLGRKHPSPASDDPSTDDVREGCGHSRSDPSFPYTGARISSSQQAAFGFDVGDAKSPRAVYPWNMNFDVMSYCNNYWVSDYTYAGLYGGMATLESLGATAGGEIVDDWIFVQGSVRPAARTGQLYFARRHLTPTELPPEPRGLYRLELLGAGGAVLDSVSLETERVEESVDGREEFSGIVPCIAEARSLRVVVAADGSVLVSQPLSANPPVIQSLTMSAGASPVSGPVRLGWLASDADGDELSFDVSWLPAARGSDEVPVLWSLSGASFEVPTSELPGGAGRFRVIASDGVHCASRDSDPVTLASKSPIVAIVTPEDGLRVEYSQLVRFEVEAWDPNRTGISSIVWSTGARRLGLGSAITVADLPIGTNLVIATVTNAAGRQSSDAVTVVVHDDLGAPGPILSVAPPSIVWTVPSGSPSVSVSLGVSNVGGGSISFSASESAPWLSLSATAGTAPGTITATGNPAGIPAGTVLTASITISTSVGEPQSIEVPVALIVGSEFLTGGETGGGDAGSFRRGDANGDGASDISDAVATLAFLFTGGAAPACADGADVNDDGRIDISDPVAELNFLFLGAARPPAPGPTTCGADPTPDALPACGTCP